MRRVKLPFFTVGHSDRPVDAFLPLVRASEIEIVADVRAIARSRANPQFDADPFAAASQASISRDSIGRNFSPSRGQASMFPAGTKIRRYLIGAGSSAWLVLDGC